MSVLPASLRASLWATAAFAGRLPLEDAIGEALPEVDHCVGLLERLELWRDLGERMVLPVLPRPGALGGLPGGSADFIAAATAAQEAIVVPGLGGAAVPEFEAFGPEGDQGWQVTWQPFDTDPVPVHALAAVALPDVELHLRREVAALTVDLAATGRPPLGGADLRGHAQTVVEEDAALPAGLPQRAVRVLELAGRITALAQAGLDHRLQSVDSHGTVQRESVLRHLHGQASAALAQAGTVACLHLAQGH